MKRNHLLTLMFIVVIVSVVVTASLRTPTLAQKFLWAPPPTPTSSQEERGPTSSSVPSSGPEISLPAPFYYIAERITFDELTDLAKNRSLNIYLPTWMPGHIRLTTIYYSGGLIMLSYSDRGITDYRYDNVTIQISVLYQRIPSPAELERIAEESPDTKALDVDGVCVVLNEKACWGDPELEELYGPSPFAYFWRDNHYYMVSVTPPITSDQLVEIIRNMKPLTP